LHIFAATLFGGGVLAVAHALKLNRAIHNSNRMLTCLLFIFLIVACVTLVRPVPAGYTSVGEGRAEWKYAR